MTALKTTRTLSALALAAAFAAAPLAASAAPGTGPDNGPRHHQKAEQHHGKHHGDHWLRGLDLSQDQKDQIFKIRHDQEKAAYEQKKALGSAAAALRDAQRAQPFDQDKAKQAAESLGQAKGQLALLQAQSMAQIHAVLTPEQQKKLAERHGKKGTPKAKS
ncbi:Spy/CpxP family protein refolding chaperone [Castellaniella hirudinis]|uniref:Spy/CpxP family protein refolding chaperone n=1 Tax=Castellaniella hirudinis TaxID=1144617 RepID=UPI0039C029A9